jgi:hypothetical protein
MSNALGNGVTNPSAGQGNDAATPAVDNETNPDSVDAYLEAVHQTSQGQDPDFVESRLARLKVAITNRQEWRGRDWNELLDSLTQYSFQVVRSWLAILAVGDGSVHAEQDGLPLAGDDVDRLAELVVSRAEQGFRGEVGRIRWWLDGQTPAMKELHLVECLIQLPWVYRNWRLNHSDSAQQDSLERLATSSDESWLIQRLYRYFSEDRNSIVHALRTLRYNDTESGEVVDGTLAAFDLLARRGGSR